MVSRTVSAASTCFNPRSRTGSDFDVHIQRRFLIELQSTLPHGERPELFKITWADVDLLQSTLPHGERPPSRRWKNAATMLQSTLPHGERPMQRSLHQRGSEASIHAPARGATQTHGLTAHNHRCFNPRSRTGSDVQELAAKVDELGFNPRSRTGSDCGPFLPLPRNDIQGIFRAGHVS